MYKTNIYTHIVEGGAMLYTHPQHIRLLVALTDDSYARVWMRVRAYILTVCSSALYF